MIYEAMNYCTDVGKVMLQELVGENKRAEVRSKKYEGQPKNGHSGQNRTGGKRDGAAAGKNAHGGSKAGGSKQNGKASGRNQSGGRGQSREKHAGDQKKR